MTDNHDISERMARLEERMNTIQADLTATLERFRADMAQHREDAARRDADMANDMARRDADMAQHREDAAKREKDNLRWQIGLWIATIVVLGILVRWPV